MRRRLDIAMSLIGNPQVIFLDEPTAGLDPQARLEVWQAVKALAANGTTVLLTTQYLDPGASDSSTPSIAPRASRRRMRGESENRMSADQVQGPTTVPDPLLVLEKVNP